MIRDFNELIKREKTTGRLKKVAVAAAQDEHTLAAVSRAYTDGITEPVLIGDVKEIKEIIEKLGLPLKNVRMVEAADNRAAAKAAVQLARSGEAQLVMKGRLRTSDLLGEVVNRTSGLRSGAIMSHVGILEIPGYHKLLAVTDGGMVPYPSLAQKVQILENAVHILSLLGYKNSKAAVLCATEAIDPKMPESIDAGEMKRMNQEKLIRGCIVEGPISYDLALSMESAEIKGFKSPVAGDADILLVPTMTAGNLMAKALMLSAGAKMAGMIVGTKVPVVLVSRGAMTEEKYLSIVLSAAAITEK